MYIRRACAEDIPGLERLLKQVLTIHHEGRPDLFKGGVTKYTNRELEELLKDASRPIFVAVDEQNWVLGYAFCIFQQTHNHNILTDRSTLYIDDLCVDEGCRGQHIGSKLYEYVQQFARDAGCHALTLNVWAFNAAAKSFYEKLGMQHQRIMMETIL